jgi:hypothetical protein
MFTSSRHGAEAVPAIQGDNGRDRDFLNALDECMTRELGDGLDRPNPLCVLVPTAVPAEKFSFRVKLHSSWAREANEFCDTLRFLGGECTDAQINGEEVSFTMTIQPSNSKRSPAGDGHGARSTFKFQQVGPTVLR